MEHWHFLETLNFISSELHKTFSQLFGNPPDEWKQKTLDKVANRFDLLQGRLGDKPYLHGDFTVADAYAFTIMTWASKFDIDLGRWPKLRAYYDRVKARPAVQRAIASEGVTIKP